MLRVPLLHDVDRKNDHPVHLCASQGKKALGLGL